MRDITEVLRELKEAPFVEREIVAAHTGVVRFSGLEEGTKVTGISGTWKERPGTLLATITREKNPFYVTAHEDGVAHGIHRELDGCFVEAGTPLCSIRHFLTKHEVVSLLLKESLYAFCASERARYYFVPEVDKKVKILGCKTVSVTDGMELFIISRMKREVPLCYRGPEGIIYDVYFDQSRNVEPGETLIVVCPPDQQNAVESVIAKVQTEWTGEA